MRRTEANDLVAGVDTHRDTHTAAVCDRAGKALAVCQFTAGPDGYAAMLAWPRRQAGDAGLACTVVDLLASVGTEALARLCLYNA